MRESGRAGWEGERPADRDDAVLRDLRSGDRADLDGVLQGPGGRRDQDGDGRWRRVGRGDVPGRFAIGLVIVLVPMLLTKALTPTVPPQDARGPADAVDRQVRERISERGERHQVAPLQSLQLGQTGPASGASLRSQRSRIARQHRTPPRGRWSWALLADQENRTGPDRELGWIRKRADREPARSALAPRRCCRGIGNFMIILSSDSRPELAAFLKVLTRPGLVVKGVTSTSDVGLAPPLPVGRAAEPQSLSHKETSSR